MLSNEQVAEVKAEWLGILGKVKRGFDKDALVGYLESVGFFEAPASTKYHCAFKGGLALHSINVSRALYQLVRASAEKVPNPEWEEGNGKPREILRMAYDNDSLILVGLLHDVAKAGLYEPYAKNEKVYGPYGKKKDDLGNFDWVASLAYRVKDSSERDSVGPRGFAAYHAVSRYVPLTEEEALALVNQAAPGEDFQGNLSDVFAKHNLAAYLHAADVVATYCIEHD